MLCYCVLAVWHFSPTLLDAFICDCLAFHPFNESEGLTLDYWHLLRYPKRDGGLGVQLKTTSYA